MEIKKVSLVIPTISRDLPVFLKNIDLYFDYLPITNVFIIGDISLQKQLPCDNRLVFLDESALLPIDAIKRLFATKCKRSSEMRRCGWYIQQFLKMSFANICADEYYLLWDCDTIPVRSISLFGESDKPYLDYKIEFFKGYFKTLGVLLPGTGKEFSGSFIAEHMLINTMCMRSLIHDIDRNLNLEGDNAWEKIINAIDSNDLPKSGYSEFETYGTYVYKHYPEMYLLRRWHSMRYGAFYFRKGQQIAKKEMEWISKHYQALSIETNNSISLFSHIVKLSLFRRVFAATILDKISTIVRGTRFIKRKILGSK